MENPLQKSPFRHNNNLGNIEIEHNLLKADYNHLNIKNYIKMILVKTQEYFYYQKGAKSDS